MFYADRWDAGRKLAEAIRAAGIATDGYTVIGIAKGGVIVAKAVAQELGLPCQAICVDDCPVSSKRRVIATSLLSGYVVSNEDSQPTYDFQPNLDTLKLRGLKGLMRRMGATQRCYDAVRPFEPGSKAIVVDDGLVSGETVFAAADALENIGVTEILLAVPVLPGWMKGLDAGYPVVSHRISAVERPATGLFYHSFDDVSQDEVLQTLAA